MHDEEENRGSQCLLKQNSFQTRKENESNCKIDPRVKRVTGCKRKESEKPVVSSTLVREKRKEKRRKPRVYKERPLYGFIWSGVMRVVSTFQNAHHDWSVLLL